MSVIGSIEATHELCADLDNLIEFTKESRVPIRALSFLSGPAKICRPTSMRSSAHQALPATGRARAEGEGEIGTMEKLVALTIVVVVVAFAMVYTVAALKGKSKGK
jgi:hypothetical protein